jgi:hypothetical protein
MDLDRTQLIEIPKLQLPEPYKLPKSVELLFGSDEVDLDEMTTSERKKWHILNTPTDKCKYIHVWQRIKLKIKSKLMIMKVSKEIQLYGTSTIVEQKNSEDPFKKNGTKKTKTLFGPIIQDMREPSFPIFMLHPEGRAKTFWNVVVTLLLIYTAIVMPMRLAFIEGEVYDTWWCFELALDCLFFLDILVNFISAYFDTEGNIVTNRRQIAATYAKSWFLLDVIACFPFDYVANGPDEESNSGGRYNSLLRILRLPRLYRIIRLSRLLKILKHAKNSEFLDKLQEFFSVKHSNFYLGAARLVSFFITVLAITHIVACLWYYSAKFYNFSPDTWVVRHGYQDESIQRLYIISTYWAYTTLCTVGYGDITAQTNLEMILAIFWMLSGIFFFSFTIGSLSSMLSSIDTK